MNFILAIDQLKKFLNDNSGTLYRVVGFPKQVKNADTIESLPMVQVFHGGGTFDRSTASINGQQNYSPSIIIRLTVVEPATVDLDVLDDPDATTEERILAIEESVEAENRADVKCDELFAYLFSLIMGYRGMKFGSESPTILFTDRFGEDFRKEIPQKKGSLATINAYYGLTIKTQETPQSLIGVPLETIETTVDFQGGIDALQITTTHTGV